MMRVIGNEVGTYRGVDVGELSLNIHADAGGDQSLFSTSRKVTLGHRADCCSERVKLKVFVRVVEEGLSSVKGPDAPRLARLASCDIPFDVRAYINTSLKRCHC